MEVKIGIVDDHQLFRSGIKWLLDVDGFQITLEAENGANMVNQLERFSKNKIPDVVLLDINMPEMNGFETANWLRSNYPDIKVIILTMIDNEESMIRMLKIGVHGYLTKDIEKQELVEAIKSVMKKSHYYTDVLVKLLAEAIREEESSDEKTGMPKLTERETSIIKLMCTELTYSEIAERLYLSPKTVDSYRNALFAKFGVKTRVGLAMAAVKSGVVVN
jgi:two-component system, NarL family, invasion response regulator UvrY